MNVNFFKVAGINLLWMGVVCHFAVAANSSGYKSGGSISLIEKAFTEGKINRGEKMFRDLQAILAPRELPVIYKGAGNDLVRCGTPFVREAQDNWGLMTPQQQSLAAKYMARPTQDSVYISPEGYFKIHYDLVGFDSVPNQDLDMNQVPDYVERIGIYADSSYRHYHQNLGYLPHPSDGDQYYDIHLLIMGAGTYGVTMRELYPPGDSSWDDYRSYIQINSTFDTAAFPPNDDPEGQVIGDQKVTCAHEYYHATQFAYDGLEDLWWIEASASYFEEVVYPEVNDNYNYLSYFFDYPDTFLTSNGYHPYGTFVWPGFLAEDFGINFIRSIWESCRFYTSLPSIDTALSKVGKRLSTVFPEFTVWNYFTGARSNSIGYDSSMYFPEMPLDRVIPACPFSPVAANKPPDGLASAYLVTYPSPTTNGLLKIDFDGSNSVVWGFSYITFLNGQITVSSNCPIDVQGRTDCGLYDFIRYDSIVFIPCVVTPWLDDNQFSFKTVIYPPGDANGTGEVNIQDITYVVNFLYKSGPPPKYDQLMADADCNGVVNILDLTYLIKFLYKGGPQPCVYSP
jgi:hypothetical protein